MADAESIFATIAAGPYLSPTVVSYTTLLNGYVRAATRPGLGSTGGDGGGPVEGGLQMAEDIFYRRMFEAGILPSTVTLTALANGYLDAAEFSALLDTANLGLDATEKRQLLMMCDINGDGRIEYAEV